MLVIDKNFGLKWSFKYSKNNVVSTKPWYLKQSFFYYVAKHLLAKKYYSILQYHSFTSKLQKNTLLTNTPVVIT
jgi:hypothetical protein